MNTLSIIIPTINRPSLRGTLHSIAQQTLLPGDEVLLGAEGCADALGVLDLHPYVRVIDCGKAHGDWGHTARNLLMPHARGDWLLFIDDDDEYIPGAFNGMREALGPSVPHLFRMQYPDGQVLWSERSATYGNVSTQMIVVPRCGPLGEWYEGKYEGDCDFILGTIEKYDGRVEWREGIMVLVRPNHG